MAVYGRTYRAYSGPLTPERQRPWVITRYGLAELFDSRFFLAQFLLCFVAPLVASIRIYLGHNSEVIAIFQMAASQVEKLLAVDAAVFRNWVLWPQSVLAFLLALSAGPTLISPDLRNNAMPLYLARPLSRMEYIAGKLVALLIPLAAVTLAPTLVLYLFQCLLAGFSWTGQNLWLGPALAAACLVWILALSLAVLAISAVVKWRPVARLAIFILPVFLSGAGLILNLVLKTQWGSLLRLGDVLLAIWASLLALPLDPGSISPWAAWAMLILVSALSLLVLRLRVRAYEVER